MPAESTDPLSTPRLEAWLRATTTPLDVLALGTIWLTILPFTRATDTSSLTFWVIGRIVLSSIYGIDVAVRCHLSTNGRRYFVKHPVSVAAVLVPPVRIIFSLRLLTAMFRKGNLGHFLFVAMMLVLNGVILVYFFEEGAPGSNIETLGESLWWAAVTVATVGYGDFYPVTTGGRITAVGLMAVGLITAAVVTAQVASTFMDQAALRRAELAAQGPPAPRRRLRRGATPAEDADGLESSPAETVTDVTDLADVIDLVDTGRLPADAPSLQALIDRLDRIEALLRSGAGDGGGTGPGPAPGTP